jgi:nitrite reductase/ring-hydroxylating ferredoxin subunit/uncharacterized membrane protein
MLERVARPMRGLGNGTATVVKAFFGVLRLPGRLLQDFLNGTWLGHSLHAVLVDLVVGGATAVLLLDALRVFFGVDGLADATTWVVALVGLSGVGSIVTGLTDFKDTSPNTSTRDVAILHGLINLVGIGAFAFSLTQRLGGQHDPAFWVFLAGYALISVGSYIGGHVVFKHGYAVNYNAHARGKRASDYTPVVALAELADGKPTKTMFGSSAVMLIRRGDVVHALKETCSHLGGPLSQGELGDDTITCPWHASTFRLRDGAVVHGPATSRQLRYEARVTAGQVELRGPRD